LYEKSVFILFYCATTLQRRRMITHAGLLQYTTVWRVWRAAALRTLHLERGRSTCIAGARRRDSATVTVLAAGATTSPVQGRCPVGLPVSIRQWTDVSVRGVSDCRLIDDIHMRRLRLIDTAILCVVWRSPNTNQILPISLIFLLVICVPCPRSYCSLCHVNLYVLLLLLLLLRRSMFRHGWTTPVPQLVLIKNLTYSYLLMRAWCKCDEKHISSYAANPFMAPETPHRRLLGLSRPSG